MALKQQVSMAELKVGILVTISLILMAALILHKSWGFGLFTKSIKAMTYLPDVGGLKPGAPAWLSGIEIGRVRKVTLVPPDTYPGNEDILQKIAKVRSQIESIDPKAAAAGDMTANLQDNLRALKEKLRIIEVQLEIRSEFLDRISRDSEVVIQSRGLIGDSFIQISAGTYGVPPVRKGDFYLIEGVRTTSFREIMTGANDVIANFGVLSDQVKNIAFKINPDRIGAGVADTIQGMQKALSRIDETFVEASALLKDLRNGQGTMGRLIADPTLYHRLTESLDRLNKVVEQMDQGSGTMGKLLRDPALYDHARETLRKGEIIMDRIEKGEGTLGMLSRDDALYASTRRAVDRFAALVEQVDKGEGSMGKLLRDPSLYNNLNQSTAEMTKFIYDLRRDPKKYLTIRFRVF